MCDASWINGCTKQGTIKIVMSEPRDNCLFCSEECANEYAGEVSEGTWCPFPNASNALTKEQIDENLTYFRE